MHHRFAEINQHPFADVQPLDTEGALTVAAQLLDDLVGGGLNVARGGAADNHHVIGEIGHLAHIEHHDVLGFGVVQRVHNQAIELLFRHRFS